ncbi:heat shock factor protein 5-like [Strigops habroptila]|uniref:heat shock factor protein 5-like n=1 Tax=Strigops habroptila TaxID=2489341 RepID=UPI0011CFF154|nr:heat shock factor protein 5-like [Strigops habroptila]
MESEEVDWLLNHYTSASIESAAAAETVQDSVTTQEAPEERREQLDHCPAQLPEMFVLEGLFSAEQENTSVKCESVTEESQLTSGSKPVTKPAEEPGSPVKPQCRKRRHSSHQDPQELGGGACNPGCFTEEDTRVRSV